MIENFWTITQRNEIKEICKQNDLPQAIEDEIFRVISILDENYGIGRDLESDGGYVALLLSEKNEWMEEYKHILERYHLKEYNLEFSDCILQSENKEWYSDLYIISNDYGVTVIYQCEREENGIG